MSETQGEEIPKTMLILKSQITSLASVETFLRNRGWKICSTVNLKEALVQIVSSQPSYVLISMDHPNKKVRALPKILAQAFPAACIAFAENQASASFKALNEAATEYRVYPPVTGPAIERCVNKYLKDQQTRMTVQSANETFKGDGKDANGNDMISIKGGGNDNIAIKGGADMAGDAGRLFAQLLGEDGNITTTTTSGKVDNNQIFAEPLGEDDYGKTYVQKGSAGNIGNVVPPADERGQWGNTQSNNSNGMNYSGQQAGPEGHINGKLSDGIPPEGLGSREYRRKQAAAAAWAPIEDSNYLERMKEKRARSDENQTLIARGTQKSLEESVVIGDGVVKEQAKENTSAACIVVESERFSGYLVAVMGKDRKIDQAFIDSVKTKLFKFLKDNGEEVADNDGMHIKIKQVDFEPWALDYAEFLRKSVHDGNEVAMAFFPRRPIQAILEDSYHKDMAQISLTELQGDRQVEFDLYVYLPNNNKYVLYTPTGGVFYNKQMDRLKKQGITHMHVKKDAAAAISRYKAQNYLNAMIEEHEQKIELEAKIRAA